MTTDDIKACDALHRRVNTFSRLNYLQESIEHAYPGMPPSLVAHRGEELV